MPASTLQVSEFVGMAAQIEGTQAVFCPPVAEQQIAATGSSIQSSPFNALTRVVRLHAKVNLCCAFGQNPTANVTTSFAMVAGQTEYVRVNPGDVVAVIVDP